MTNLLFIMINGKKLLPLALGYCLIIFLYSQNNMNMLFMNSEMYRYIQEGFEK